MLRKIMFMLPVAAAMAVVSAPAAVQAAVVSPPALKNVVKSDVVQVRRRGRYIVRRGYRRHRGPRVRLYIGPPVRYYGGGCHWLKRRAIRTGSRYWWRRYYACRY